MFRSKRLSIAFLFSSLVLLGLGGLRSSTIGSERDAASASDSGLQAQQTPSETEARPVAASHAVETAATRLPSVQAPVSGVVSTRLSMAPETIDLALHREMDGACLTEPRVRVIDPLLQTPIVLKGTELVGVAASPERLIQVESDDAAWIVERTEFRIRAGQKGPIEIYLRPRHRILVNLSEASTQDWIQSAKLQVHWEESGTGRREASKVLEMSSESGGYILEAPPLIRGRVRVEAVAEARRPERSHWMPVEASTGWVEFNLALPTLEESTAEVLVTVIDQDQAKVQGAWVSVFEEIDSMPLVGVRVTQDALEPLREGRVDPDLMDNPPTAATIEGGLAGFKLKAPGNYRIASWVRGQGDTLSKVVHFEPGDTRELTLVFGATSVLQGRVLASLEDFPSGTVKQFGDLRLYDPGANKSYLAELKRDGTFRFDGVAPGDYRLEVSGVVEGLHGKESVIPLMSRKVSLGIGQDKWVELAMGNSAPGHRVSGRVDFGIKMEQWAFMVGLMRLSGDPIAKSGEGPDLHSRQLLRANTRGEFEFSAIEPGRYRVVSLGVRTDRQALAFLYQDVDLREGQAPPGPVLLAPLGEPLYLQLADPQADPRELSVRVEADDALNGFLIDQASELLVGNAFPSVFFGLPEGELTLRSGDEELELVVDRASVVLVP